MADLLLDIMAKMEMETVSFCLHDIIPLLLCSQVKAEKLQVRKVVQECWSCPLHPTGLPIPPTCMAARDAISHAREWAGITP